MSDEERAAAEVLLEVIARLDRMSVQVREMTAAVRARVESR